MYARSDAKRALITFRLPILFRNLNLDPIDSCFDLKRSKIASLGSRDLIANNIYASTRLPCQDKRKPNGGAVRLGKSLAPVRNLKALQCQAYHCQVALMHSRRYHFVHFPFRRGDTQYATQDESSLGRTASYN
jgi:hypothetical protein